MRISRRPMVAACLLLALGACARTTVRPSAQTTAVGLQRPERILVYAFAVTAADVRANEGVDQRLLDSMADTTPDAREIEIGRQVSARLAEDLVAGIRELGLPAEQVKRGTRAAGNVLLIDGEFLNVDEGNRLQRLVIGLGAGSATVDTRVQVYRAARPGAPVLEFITHADSGAMPGAAITMGAGTAAPATGGIKANRSRAEFQAGESADQAVAYLSEFFVKHGWISPDKVRRARRDR